MRSGLSTVWLNAHGRTLPEGIEPTWTVTSLNELGSSCVNNDCLPPC